VASGMLRAPPPQNLKRAAPMPSWLSALPLSRLEQLLQVRFLDNSLQAWSLALMTALLTLTILPLIRRHTARERRRWNERGQTVHYTIDLVALLVERTIGLFPWALAIYLGSKYLVLPPDVSRVLTFIIVVGLWAQIALWAMTGVRFLIDQRRKSSPDFDALLAGSMDVIVAVAGIIIWAMALLLALDNLDIQVRPLLAGLGISGIAVALAVQTVLSDLFASMSIALDRPFVVGDFLTLGDVQGTVEHIGVKSTRLRALSGEQIIMSNADILKTKVRNFGRMRERRAVFQFGVAYETDTATVGAIPDAVREIVSRIPEARFDRCHFLSYTNYALQFEAVYYVTTSDYNKYADVQHRINLDLLEHLRSKGVSFNSPSRTVVDLERLPRGLHVDS
jgi:small-conductance mechanosensitive channel